MKNDNPLRSSEPRGGVGLPNALAFRLVSSSEEFLTNTFMGSSLFVVQRAVQITEQVFFAEIATKTFNSVVIKGHQINDYIYIMVGNFNHSS